LILLPPICQDIIAQKDDLKNRTAGFGQQLADFPVDLAFKLFSDKYFL